MDEREKQIGISMVVVCFKLHLVDLPLNSCWIDTGESINITNSLYGFKVGRS